MSADIFGDASLFDEFEKERDVRSTYVKQDDADRGAIIFNASDLESESESSIGSSDSEEETEQVENDTNRNQLDTNIHTGDTVEQNSDGPNSSSSVPSQRHMSNTAKSITSSRIGNIQFTLHKTVKYDDVIIDEDSRNDNTNINQMDWRNGQDEDSYINQSRQRFSSLIDSSRFCIDEESPAVQVLYQNNSFSRRNRHRIEGFIQWLLEKDRQENDNQPLPDLELLPGVKSTTDMRKTGPDNDRCTDSVRKAHIVLGCSQYYREFMCDAAGWPLVNSNPSLTDSWIIPTYEQAFPESLPCSEESGGNTAPQRVQRPKSTCFNCGGDHMLADCKMERDHKRIRDNRRMFTERSPGQNPKLSLKNRYHIDDDPRFAVFKPGIIGEELRKALGLRHFQLPEYIYSMRLLGYPPGWLLEARDQASGIAMFDKHGKEVSVSGDSLEDGEVMRDETPAVDLVPSKIIEYPGFTVPVPKGFVDECYSYRMPPIQPHQLKVTVEETVQQQEETLKRKARDMEDIKSKHGRYDNSNLKDMDLDESSDSPQTHSAPATPSSMTPPPLPTDTPPVPPPLPDGTPPATPTPPVGRLFRSPLRLPPPKVASPLCTPPGSSLNPARQVSVESSSSDGAPLEDLEKQYRSIVHQLESCPEDNISKEAAAAIERVDSIASPENDTQILDSSDVVEIPSQPSSPFTDLYAPSPTMANEMKIHNKSIEMKLGTPIHQAAVFHPGLPSRAQFGEGVEDHLLFENLPESTGTFERMRGLLSNIKKKLSVSKKKKK